MVTGAAWRDRCWLLLRVNSNGGGLLMIGAASTEEMSGVVSILSGDGNCTIRCPYARNSRRNPNDD